MDSSKYGKYIVSKLQMPERFTAEYNTNYAKWAKRTLWMDNKVVEGAFQMNCAWYMKPPFDHVVERLPHKHDVDEILGFFGSNPENPYDLGGEVEFWLEDEKHIIINSAMIFIPHGLTHCPLLMLKIDRPIFHFSTVMAGQYVPKFE